MMDVRPIHNEADYNWALKEVEKYFDNQPAIGSPNADRFDVLSTLIKDYEDRNFSIPHVDPVEVLHFAIENMSKTQADLGHLIGRSRASEVLSRQRPLTLAQIRVISKAWNLPIATLADEYTLQQESA